MWQVYGIYHGHQWRREGQGRIKWHRLKFPAWACLAHYIVLFCILLICVVVLNKLVNVVCCPKILCWIIGTVVYAASDLLSSKSINRGSWFQGKTVEVGRAHFETETTRFTILDAPVSKFVVSTPAQSISLLQYLLVVALCAVSLIDLEIIGNASLFHHFFIKYLSQVAHKDFNWDKFAKWYSFRLVFGTHILLKSLIWIIMIFNEI